MSLLRNVDGLFDCLAAAFGVDHQELRLEPLTFLNSGRQIGRALNRGRLKGETPLQEFTHHTAIQRIGHDDEKIERSRCIQVILGSSVRGRNK